MTLQFLLLEDNPLDAEMVELTLSDGSIDCELLRVETRSDFVAALETNEFDLILADYSLPGFDGISALEIACQLRPDVPFIFVSGSLGEELAIEALKWGATDYVLKQRLGRLVPCVQRALREAQEHRELKQAEAALRQSEARLHAVAANLPNGAVFVVDRELRYRLAEGQAIEDVCLSSEDLVGKTLWEALDPDLADRYEAYFRQALAGEPFSWEHHSHDRDYISHGTPLYDERGEVEAVLAVSYDISDRVRYERDRERIIQQEQSARDRAETANRIKDEFLAVVSHELRSPLNPILGWAKLLRTRKFDEKRTTEGLQSIERNAQLQSQLIDDLLDISRILRGKLSLKEKPVDLSRVISFALETVRLAAEAKSLELKFEVIDPGVRSQESEVRSQKSENISPSSPSLPLSLSSSSPHPPIPPSPPASPSSPSLYVVGDAGRLQQVVWNLVSNAVKFTPQGGQVAVELTQTETHAQIQVTDTGKGISPDFLPHVFEHFRQESGATTRQFGGLGLGLAIARQIVEMHGGTVTVDSAGEGQGATFTVQIPLAPKSIAPATIETSSAPTTDLSGISILVVDDETDSREVVAFVLEQAGAIVTSAASAIEALQAIDRFVPDLIVSDIGMPQMDGYMLLQEIRMQESTREVPAIALTAYAGEFDRQQALKAGFQMHLAKPLEPEELVKAIDRLIRSVK
ncbi:MAG: response regulator [Cyanosarcina radialis HA8281-LM2]|jgi:PAS domain S-box-containing protein|nr:response regulator [Cyanosarcina radialis HA8281-LM2]